MPTSNYQFVMENNYQTHTNSNIAGDQIANYRQDNGMPNSTIGVDSNVSSASTNVNQGYPQVGLTLFQHRIPGGQWFQDKVLNLDVRFVHTFYKIMHRRHRTRDDMRLHLQAKARHTYGILDALLPIDNIPARNNVN